NVSSNGQQQAPTPINATSADAGNSGAAMQGDARAPENSGGPANFGQLFGQDDALKLADGMAVNPSQPAAGVASPVTVGAYQGLFLGGDGRPVSVSQLYDRVAPYVLRAVIPAQGAQIPEGAQATNPQTGQRIIFKGGQWQPLP